MNPVQSVSIHPYFRVAEGRLDDFRAMLPDFIERTRSEEGCLQYEFTLNGDVVFCRECYTGGDAALAHLANVDDLLKKALEISDLMRLELHGPAEELNKLREPLASLDPDWFVWEAGLTP